VFALSSLLLLRPTAPIKPAPLPNPNGYDDFVNAGRLVSKTSWNYRSLTRDELGALVAENAEALKLVRLGLTKECRVPIEYSQEYLERHLQELSSTKMLGVALAAE